MEAWVFEDEASYHTIDSTQLLRGDIILTTDPDSVLSAVIRTVTGSEFSHAIICTNPPWCVESAGFGVVRFMIDRFLLRDHSRAMVLRLRGDPGARLTKAERAAQWAEEQVLREYAHKDVFFSLFRGLPQLERGKFFCSQLVTEAYRQADVELVSGVDPTKTAPGALASSPELYDVTASCVRVATSEEKLRCTAFLDGGSMSTPVTDEVRLKQRIMKQLRPLLSAEGVKAETFDELLRDLGLGWVEGKSWVCRVDAEFSSSMKELGLFGLLERLCPPNSDHFFIDAYLFQMLEAGLIPLDKLSSLRGHYEYLLEKRDRSIRELREQVKVSWWAFAKTGLASWQLNLAMSDATLSVLLRQRRCIASCVQILGDLMSGREGPGA